MAKKDKNQEIVFSPDTNDVRVEDEPLFESEAYASPQPDAGSDVTVTKPVGIGGPVPIVAPKHNTIQLQPIVVPLAVVPYMTQDSSVLRTDGRPQGGTSMSEYDEATDFETVEQENIKKKVKVQPRIFALVTLLLSTIVLLPFILSYFLNDIGNASLEQFDIIGTIMDWAENEFYSHPLRNFAYIGVAGVSVIMMITAIISLICGKYPRAFNFILSGGVAAAMVALLIRFMVAHESITVNNPVFIALITVALLNFVLVIIFSIVLNKLDDKMDESNRSSHEI